MIRTIAFIQRRPDLDRNAFRTYYEERHAPLARPHLRGLRHYVRNHVLEELDDAAAGFDAISEFEYADRAAHTAMLSMLDSAAGDVLRADEMNFMHKPGNSFFQSDCSPLSALGRPQPGAHPKAVFALHAADSSALQELATAATQVARDALHRAHAVHAELDAASAGNPLGEPAWEVLLHLWYEQDATPSAAADALGALRTTLAGGADVLGLWIAEHGSTRGGEPGR